MAYKTWNTGDVLTAADLNTYVRDQGVIRCTSGTRPAGVTEGALIYETDTDSLAYYNGTVWVYLNNPGTTVGSATGRRNVIRNGDMSVWQRGAGAFTTTSTYTADGWVMAFVGGSMSVGRTTPALGLGDAKFVLTATTAGQAAAGDWAYLNARIESVLSLAGKTVTLSFIALAASGTPKIGVEISQVFGTGGSPSVAVNTAVSAVTINNTRTRYSVTFTVPSVTGKTLGTNDNDYLGINLWLSSGSTNAARASSIGIQNNTFDITDVQLEAGNAPTPFERLSIAEQLAWCQRYFERATASTANNTFLSGGMSYGTSSGSFVWMFKTLKRSHTGTLSHSAFASLYVLTPAGGGQALTGNLTAIVSCADSVNFSFTSAAVFGGGGQSTFLGGTVGAYIEWSAEL